MQAIYHCFQGLAWPELEACLTLSVYEAVFPGKFGDVYSTVAHFLKPYVSKNVRIKILPWQARIVNISWFLPLRRCAIQALVANPLNHPRQRMQLQYLRDQWLLECLPFPQRLRP